MKSARGSGDRTLLSNIIWDLLSCVPIDVFGLKSLKTLFSFLVICLEWLREFPPDEEPYWFALAAPLTPFSML